jgi:carboxymethylenebutenolidase
MREEDVTIDLPNGPMTCFLASPDDRTRGPAIVVIQEWWGLNDQIRGVARRFASSGFASLAPDLYRGQQADEPDDARKLAMELDHDAAAEDVRGLVAWLLESRATRVGVTGFCMGGGITWTVARTEPAISAAVPFYGGVDFREGGPALAPFQGHYGTRDRFPAEMYEQIERHLGDAPGSELWRYRGAGHAFMNEEGHSFDPDAAALAWERAVAFFRRHLADQPA